MQPVMIEGNVRGLFPARATAHRNPIPKGNLPSIEKCFPLRQNRPAQRNRTNKFLLNCSYRLVGLQRPFVTLKPLHHLYPCICVNNCRLMWESLSRLCLTLIHQQQKPPNASLWPSWWLEPTGKCLSCCFWPHCQVLEFPSSWVQSHFQPKL